MTDVPWMERRQSPTKPSWMPAPSMMGLIRQILYPIVIAPFGFVFVEGPAATNRPVLDHGGGARDIRLVLPDARGDAQDRSVHS